MSMSKRMGAVVTGSALLVVVGAGLATADPTGAPTFRALAGVGSDTTQGVMNGIANDVLIGGVKQIGSYDAFPGGAITTKDPVTTPACSNLARPNGSTAGRNALLNSLNANAGAGDGCLQFARSSALNVTPSTPSLTYIPFAKDAVAYAVTTTSGLSRTLNKADLQHYYTCDPAYVGTSPVAASDPTNTFTATPILPQLGSGTRSFWIAQMGITETQISAGSLPCIINGTKNGQLIEEHNGSQVDDKSLVPFSIAQYDAQSTSTLVDVRGRTVLGSIGTGLAGAAISGLTFPNNLNIGFNINRDVYNVIPTAQLGNAPFSTVFVGPTSLVCADTATISKFGFGIAPNCGDTANRS